MKKFVVVDIDGTIANVEHRLHFMKSTPKNNEAFHDACDKDEPIEEMIELVQGLMVRYNIIFCTGRPEKVRKKTSDWITKHIKPFEYPLIVMREDGDERKDEIVKPEELSKVIPLDKIAFILEDRTSVVKAWRELGVKCLQVAEGDF